VPEVVDVPAAPVASAVPMQAQESARQDSCMTASQLLMQRYMLDQPPPRHTYEAARHYEPSRFTHPVPAPAHMPRQPGAAPPDDVHGLYMQQPQRVYRDAPEHAE